MWNVIGFVGWSFALGITAIYLRVDKVNKELGINPFSPWREVAMGLSLVAAMHNSAFGFGLAALAITVGVGWIRMFFAIRCFFWNKKEYLKANDVLNEIAAAAIGVVMLASLVSFALQHLAA